MHDQLIILDFGSQYTQLIARRVRELGIYCEIFPYNNIPDIAPNVKGIILSGSPFSVREKEAPVVDLEKLISQRPVLGICYGAQMMANNLGGRVEQSEKREYGRAFLIQSEIHDPILDVVEDESQVWMSHADSILELPDTFERIAATRSIPTAAFRSKEGAYPNPVYGLQFHPEVTHTLKGSEVLSAFAISICNCEPSWTPASFVDESVAMLRERIDDDAQVVLGLSGGVDSSVAALLLHKAIGDRLHCLFVDNGLLRKNEFEDVLRDYQSLGLNIKGVDAGEDFLTALDGIDDPEKKRKAIGRVFIEVFEREAKEIDNVRYLGQGTIYPDVIESVSVHGPSVTIKSHHNVGGLPERLNLEIVEPLRMLFKDEVRRVGKAVGLPSKILKRHPFPGPGLAIRILGEISKERIRILQECDHIFINNLKKYNLYDEVWQAGVMLLPVQSVGVMGDERTYEHVVALRSVNSLDGMTADWSKLPYDFLGKTSNDIINSVKGVNRVVYDISSKPPATIEWE